MQYFLNYKFFGFILLLGIVVNTGCYEQVNEKFKATPLAYGKLNQIFVIADKDLWEGPVGDTFQYYFGSPYLILPQPEPVFDIKHFTPREFYEDPLRKELKTLVFLADFENEESTTAKIVRKDIGTEKVHAARDTSVAHSTVGRDKWAKKQLLIYLYANNKNALVKTIKKTYPAARDRIYRAAKEEVEATVFQGGTNNKITSRIREILGISMRIPKDYYLAVEDDRTLWLRKETDELSSNILLTKRSYKDASQLSKDGLRRLRDTLGRKYISTRAANTYMVTNDIDLPLFLDKTTVNGHYAVVLRGIWEIENDYMGGPFVSYAILNEAKNEFVFADGFVFAPGEKKRDYMIYLEAILKTIRW